MNIIAYLDRIQNGGNQAAAPEVGGSSRGVAEQATVYGQGRQARQQPGEAQRQEFLWINE